MPINPAISLGLAPQQPVDLLGTYGQVLSLKNLVNQGRMQELQGQQYERDINKKMRLADLARAAGGDISKYVSGMAEIDPEGALDYGMKVRKQNIDELKATRDAEESGLKVQKAKLELTGQIIGALGENPTAGQIMDGALFAVQKGLLPDLSGVPSPDNEPALKNWYQTVRRQALTAAQQMEQDRPLSEVGRLLQDNKRYYSQNAKLGNIPGAIQGQSPFEPAILRATRGPAPHGFMYNDRGEQVPDPQVQEYEKNLADRRGVKVQQFNNTKDDFKNERDLRNDMKSEPIYKAHQEVKTAYGQIGKALELKSPAGDLAAATKIMKLLDPNSVVRESELAMAMAASGLEDRLRNYVTNVINGTKLTPAQRADFRKLADELYSESQKAYSAKAKEYGEIASEYGLNPRRVGGPGQQTTFDQMPDPKDFVGRKIQAPDGTVYRSDGKKWNKDGGGKK